MKRIPASFEAGALRGKGYVKNVSKRGLFVRTTVLPRIGSDVHVAFPDRTGRKIEVRGVVRWTTEQLSAREKAKPGFAVYVPRGNKVFDEFLKQILFS